MPAARCSSTKPAARLWGTVDDRDAAVSELSGTSMAAPVVSGTVALMLQANPALTPNLVKAILQYTAEHNAGYNDAHAGRRIPQRARRRASSRSRSPAASRIAASRQNDPTPWSRHIIWGNHRIGGGVLAPTRTPGAPT